jgi:hypothetical protein
MEHSGSAAYEVCEGRESGQRLPAFEESSRQNAEQEGRGPQILPHPLVVLVGGERKGAGEAEPSRPEPFWRVPLNPIQHLMNWYVRRSIRSAERHFRYFGYY